MARSKSSGRWLNEHFSDEYVKQAQKRGYRSRAVFKLEEIDQRDRLILPGMRVLDLGAAPGGWSQYAVKKVGRKGIVVASDLLPIEPIPGVTFIEGDFREQTVLDALLEQLGASKVDLVLSDMAPNMSGVRVADQASALYLAELALDIARTILTPEGAFLVKIFHGAGIDGFLTECRNHFNQLKSRKPKASRDRSRENYLLMRGLKN